MVKTLCVVCFFIFPMLAWAQIKYNDEGEIENSEIIIEKNKKIEFPKLKKPFKSLEVPPVENNTTDYYNPATEEFKNVLPDFDIQIKVPAIKSDQPKYVRQNALRLGLGNYWTSYAEGDYLATKDRFQVGVWAHHYSSLWGSVGDPRRKSGDSKNTIYAYGQSVGKHHTSRLSLEWDRMGLHYYGSEPNRSDAISRKSIRQHYQSFMTTYALQGVDSSAQQPLHYQGKTSLSYLSDAYSKSELEVSAQAEIRIKAKDQGYVYVILDISNLNYNDSVVRYRWYSQGEVLYHRDVMDRLHLKAGMALAYENDTLFESKNVHLYPLLKASVDMSEKYKLGFGNRGGLQKTTWRNSIYENPWLGSHLPITHVSKLYEPYAQLDAQLTHFVHAQVQGSYAAYRNLPFFTPDYNRDSAKYTLIYDTKPVRTFILQGSLFYEQNQLYKIGIQAKHYTYQLSTLNRPYHRPQAEIQMLGMLNLNEKIKIQSDLSYIMGLYAPTQGGVVDKKMTDIVDINLKTSYHYNDRVECFLNLYNILNQKYSLYNNYQVRGFQVLVGIGLRL